MNVSAWSIRNPVPGILVFAMLTVLGLIGFHRLQIQDFPDMDVPTIVVSATLEGAAPSQLETEVARKIEDKLTSLAMLDHVTTTITDGSVSISVGFQLEKDTESALSDVRSAVDGARADLPASMAAPVVSKITAAPTALLTFTASSTLLDEQDLSWFVDNDLAKALLAVKGVASVKRVGGVDREVHIDLIPALMASLGVAPATVSAQLKAAQLDSSGGQGDIAGQRQSARTLGGVRNAEQIAAMTIALGDGRFVRLDQIAHIRDSHAERTSLAFRDGKPVIGVQVTRSLGYSDVSVARELRTALATFAASHPQATLAEASNTVAPIEDNYRGSMELLFEGALLAMAVVWWFLRDARATALSAIALPLSIIPTFGAMYLLGFTLNTITLLSLSLVVGVLVDDAIVEIENIARHLRMGKSPYQAAMEAADEIGLAVIATTFTLVAVFLPTAFMSGVAGKIFRQFGITASVAVLFSLLVARLLTPMMAAYLLKGAPRPAEPAAPRGGLSKVAEPHLLKGAPRPAEPAAPRGGLSKVAEPHLLKGAPRPAELAAAMTPGASEAEDGPLLTRYLGWVRGALARRKTTVLCVAAFLAVSLAMIPLLPSGFMPAQDNAQTRVTLKLPPGSTLSDTRRAADQATAQLLTLPGVRHVFSSVGTSSAGDAFTASSIADVASATLTVDLAPRGERARQSAVEATMRDTLRQLPGVRVSVGGGGNGELLQLTLAGNDAASLEAAAAALEPQLRGLHGIGNVTSSAALQRPEIRLDPDAARTAALGVTASAAAEALRIATYGDYSTSLPKLNLPERQIPLRVRIDPSQRTSLDAIGQLRVMGTSVSGSGTTNGSVALASLGALSIGSGPAQIDRLDRARNITFSIELAGRSLGEVEREARRLPAYQGLPAGVHFVEQGELQHQSELFSSFGVAMAIGIFCVYAVLVLLFHDFLQPATILCALPLSLGGALFALWVTHSSFSMPSVIGLLMLMGIVTKNSILLVEYAVIARRQRGMARFEALLDACHKRARPILMTTIAMGAGMLPNALGLGAEPSFRQPMAIVVIGGLITSTLLSLLVIPVVFTYVDDLVEWLRRRFAFASPSAHPITSPSFPHPSPTAP